MKTHKIKRRSLERPLEKLHNFPLNIHAYDSRMNDLTMDASYLEMRSFAARCAVW